MTSFSLRYNNYQYAPGIATYGIDGKPGELGLPGNSIFFTNYCLSEKERAKLFATKISDNKLPIDSEDTIIERDYRTNDLFIDPKGEVYALTDIDKLLSKVASSGEIDGCLQKVGIIPIASSITDFLTKSGGRALIKDNYNGLDIFNLTAPGSGTTKNSVLNLVSNNDKGSGDYDFINMDVIYGDVLNANLRIYFDSDLNSYHIDSSYPIVFDANTYVSYDADAPDAVDNYSKVLTNQSTVTLFYGICENLAYSLDISVFKYNHIGNPTNYYGCIYKIDIDSKDENADTLTDLFDTKSIKQIHFLRGAFQDFLNIRPNIKTYYIKEEQEYINPYDANDLTINSSNNIQISLIKNVEVYLDKK